MKLRLTLACTSVLALAAACGGPSETKAPQTPAAGAETSAPAPAPAAAQDRDILPATARPVSYDITVAPDIEALTFDGEAKLTFNVVEATDHIVVNGIGLTVSEATLDGDTTATVETDAERQRLTFVLPAPVEPGQHTLDVTYKGKIWDQAAGLFHVSYKTTDGEQSMLATQFEPGDARKLAPMWDEPALKATFKISAIVPSDYTVISNMPSVSTAPADQGRKRVDFQQTPKMSSYLLYLGAGHLDRITKQSEGVEVGVVTRAGESEKGRYALDASAQILTYYNDYFGTPYPLPKLDNIAVPGAGGFSAMENWGAIMYFEPVLLLDPKLSTPSDKQRVFEVIGHEMAHQWFGDLVTMNWWGDIWLNEGFASWMETKGTDHFHPEWNVWLQAAGGREGAFYLDSFASTHPIVQNVHNIEEANLAFDTISYQKGQEVIKMIEAYVGADAFRDGVRAYMKEHAYGNTVTSDLWSAIQSASDAPVMEIAHDFTTQPGVPMINVASTVCDDARDVSVVTLSQGRFAADAASKGQALTWRVPVTAVSTGGGDVARATISGADAQKLEVPGCGAVKINAGETGYFRTDYDDESFANLEASYPDLSSADELGLLNDAFALGETGDAPFTRYAELVTKTSTDADPVILDSITGDLLALDRLYDGRPAQAAFRAWAKGWLHPIYEQLGWDKQADEADNVTALRGGVISALARLGDAAILDEARARYNAYQTDPSTLGPDLLRTVIYIVARNADEATFDAMHAKAEAAESPTEQRLYLGALTSVQDEALAKKALDIVSSDEAPKQLRPRLIASVAGQHPELAWDYYQTHRDAIDALLDPLQQLDFASGMVSRSNDPAMADKLEAFVSANLPDSARASTRRVTDRIRFRAGVRADRLSGLDAWLEKHEG